MKLPTPAVPEKNVFNLADFVVTKRQKSSTIKLSGSLCPLTTVEPEPEALRSCKVDEANWEVVEFAVDSGASETVMPDHLAKFVTTQPNAASQRGVKYEVANGEVIPNLGQKELCCVTDCEQLRRRVVAQVCDVSKPLMSVHRLVAAGNTVVFSPSGSFIQDGATQEQIWLHEQGGMFMAKMWVPRDPAAAGF